MHREIARWRGREVAECGPDVSGLVELTSLGEGQLWFRRRFSSRDVLWPMAADGTFAPAPLPVLSADDPPLSANVAGFVPLPGDAADPRSRLLLYDPRLSDLRVFRVQPPSAALAPGATPGIFVSPEPGQWPIADSEVPPTWKGVGGSPWGHQFLALDDGYLLDWDESDGSHRFWRVGDDPNFVQMAGPYPGGAGNPAFRRGHRLVYLGKGRVLEWLPIPCAEDDPPTAPRSCAAFSIWSGAPGAGATPPGALATAVGAGTWAGVGAHDDVVRADPHHLVIWHHAAGTLISFALDPLALDADHPDPLTTAVAATPPDDRLKSIDWDPPTSAPNIKKLILILQDGHSFDSYFGLYCRGAATVDGSPLGCTDGPTCCDAMPADVAQTCRDLDPASATYKPNDAPACVRAKMNGGAMDRFGGAQPGCGDPQDIACAKSAATNAINAYHALATQGALADRFFQTYAYADDGGAYADPRTVNFLYLNLARFPGNLGLRNTPLLTKEIVRQQVAWAIYAGPQTLAGMTLFGLPAFYDPAWNPFRKLAELEDDAAAGQLPPVTVIVSDEDDLSHSETPGQPIEQGIRYVDHLVRTLDAPDTLMLVTHLTAGGYYDHVRPPEAWSLDVDATVGDAATPENRVPFGPRVPLLALGRFARRNAIAHTTLEMSSIAAFIEWNWLYGQTLKGGGEPADGRRYRDTVANNLGALLDPAEAGAAVPDVVVRP